MEIQYLNNWFIYHITKEGQTWGVASLPNLNLAVKNRNANNNNILYYCVDQVLWWVLMGTKMKGKQAS